MRARPINNRVELTDAQLDRLKVGDKFRDIPDTLYTIVNEFPGKYGERVMVMAHFSRKWCCWCYRVEPITNLRAMRITSATGRKMRPE